MSNLEHLIENTLVCIENKLPYKRILDFIKNDPNFEGNPLSVDEVWEICQYVYYTWDRSLLSTINELEQDRLKLKEERNKYLSQNDELMREIANFYHKVADVIGSDAK